MVVMGNTVGTKRGATALQHTAVPWQPRLTTRPPRLTTLPDNSAPLAPCGPLPSYDPPSPPSSMSPAAASSRPRCTRCLTRSLRRSACRPSAAPS
eukprot:171261-Chlamydomonas_euryale.AAC.3